MGLTRCYKTERFYIYKIKQTRRLYGLLVWISTFYQTRCRVYIYVINVHKHTRTSEISERGSHATFSVTEHGTLRLTYKSTQNNVFGN